MESHYTYPPTQLKRKDKAKTKKQRTSQIFINNKKTEFEIGVKYQTLLPCVFCFPVVVNKFSVSIAKTELPNTDGTVSGRQKRNPSQSKSRKYLHTADERMGLRLTQSIISQLFNTTQTCRNMQKFRMHEEILMYLI